ncbi:MAG: hypothetical protein WBL68_18435 [Nitrososphaeraceae archaeon]
MMISIIGKNESVTRKKQAEGEIDTTIQVSIELREMLKDLGKKGETYEDVIRRLIDEHKKRGDD